MQIVKPTKLGIKQAATVLRRGGVVVYPTDTAYAMGGVFDSKKVKEKILKIKQRQDDKFTAVAFNLKQADKFFKLDLTQKKLAKKYWPGPLSIVVSEKFAVRVPAEIISRTLCGLVKKPLIATSANISGQETLYDSQEIIKQFEDKPRTSCRRVNSSLPNKSLISEFKQKVRGKKNPRLAARPEPDLIIDFGRLKKVKPSTIVRCKNEKIEILRQGGTKIAK